MQAPEMLDQLEMLGQRENPRLPQLSLAPESNTGLVSGLVRGFVWISAVVLFLEKLLEMPEFITVKSDFDISCLS
jgi:hypothetical protein